MRKSAMNFSDVIRQIERVNSERDQIVLNAFSTLECRYATLARTLVESFSNRRRAAYWMCTRLRAFDGLTPYELLAEGDEDRVWEHMPGSPEGETVARSGPVRVAY